MSVFGINLFVFRSHENLKVPSCLPFVLSDFNFCDLLFENSIANHTSQKSVADVFILFILIHKVLQEQWEILDKHEESFDGCSKDFIFDVEIIIDTYNSIHFNEFLDANIKLFFIISVLDLIFEDFKDILQKSFMELLALKIVLQSDQGLL